MYERARCLPAGDRNLVVEFGDTISPEINRKIRDFAYALDMTGLAGIHEYVPTYRSLLLTYDPLIISYDDLIKRLQDLENNLAAVDLPKPNVYYLPVAYGGEFGPDLPFVCEHAGLTSEEVIKIHTGTSYLIYMLGFTPGFPYLGGMDTKIAAPRLDSPRTKIPGGSVGIAGSQTGIYPLQSPGGWRLIGQTPVKLFEPAAQKPVLLNAGDYIRFFEVTPEEYHHIAGSAEKGGYTVKISEYIGGEG
jgi:KipI family sensor histidine kinase inhibitor